MDRNMPTRLPNARRRGFASVLAMLFVALFATLAVGFYAATAMSAQVARNEQRIAEAQAAAESALKWGRRQMIRANYTPGTDPAAAFTALYTQLCTQLNGTTNMGGHNPVKSTDSSGNDVIYIPGTTGSGASLAYNWMPLGGTAGQGRVVLTRVGSDLYLKGVGGGTAAGAPARAVQVQYPLTAVPWATAGAGLLTRSPITLSNGAQITGGDVTSATAQNVAPLTMSGGTNIAKNFAYTTNSKAPVLTNGATVSGQILANIAMPSFPTVDTTGFEAFVPSKTAAAGPKVITATSTIAATANLTNIRIKANANTSFGNSITLNGVIFIESPNKVTFGGGVTVTGVIVTDNDTTTPLSGNTITLNNGVRVDGVESLNAANFAASENIVALKQLSGALIVAPNYKVTLAGGSRTYNDAMVAGQFDISNGYKGTIAGGVIGLADTAFTMMGGGQLNFTAGSTTIPGLTGGQKYAVDLTTYSEVDP